MNACPDCPDRAQCQAEDECIGRREAATDSSPGIPEWDEQPVGSDQIAQQRAIGRVDACRMAAADGGCPCGPPLRRCPM